MCATLPVSWIGEHDLCSRNDRSRLVSDDARHSELACANAAHANRTNNGNRK